MLAKKPADRMLRPVLGRELHGIAGVKVDLFDSVYSVVASSGYQFG